jgi:SecD/SecF fusion protein
VLIALMHDLLITAGVYALTGRVVSTDTVAALLTILGYSLYDTIIVFDRVRENVPRMPRAAFSQVVNRSMAEVLTRSLATTTCTLLPVLALLLFGGSTLKDFAFALLIGVASGAYSSIFIASPVLTHWKEREPAYRARRARIVAELGFVPAYADGPDVEPVESRIRRVGRLTAPQAESVSASEFEQMKRDLGLDQGARPGRERARVTPRSSTATAPRPRKAAAPKAADTPEQVDGRPQQDVGPQQDVRPQEPPVADEARETPVTRAPDIAENDGVARVKSGSGASKRPRNRKHGRRR